MESEIKMSASPKELGMLFLKNYPVDEKGYSKKAKMEDLIKINPDFKTTNGCQWARSGNGSWLGRQFNIERLKKGRSIDSIQLVGFRVEENNHNIPNLVKQKCKKRCSILDITTNIEIDHKDARYPNKELKLKDFQGLCKTANDAKRQHCKDCLKTKKRYDATRLGYSVSFVKGDESSLFCEGCYWYDPIAFNKIISANYKGE